MCVFFPILFFLSVFPTTSFLHSFTLSNSPVHFVDVNSGPAVSIFFKNSSTAKGSAGTRVSAPVLERGVGREVCARRRRAAGRCAKLRAGAATPAVHQADTGHVDFTRCQRLVWAPLPLTFLSQSSRPLTSMGNVGQFSVATIGPFLHTQATLSHPLFSFCTQCQYRVAVFFGESPSRVFLTLFVWFYMLRRACVFTFVGKDIHEKRSSWNEETLW